MTLETERKYIFTIKFFSFFEKKCVWYTDNVPEGSAIKIKCVTVRYCCTVVEQYISIHKMTQAFNSSETKNKVLVYVSWVDLIYESHKWKYSIVLSVLRCLVNNDLIKKQKKNVPFISWDECYGFFKGHSWERRTDHPGLVNPFLNSIKSAARYLQRT